MKFSLLCLALLLAGVQAACSSSPGASRNRLSPVAAATIRNGVTTKIQVMALLGPPQDIIKQVPISQPAGAAPLPAKYAATEIWTFWTAQTANRKPAYVVSIFFDAHGIVIDCQTESPNS